MIRNLYIGPPDYDWNEDARFNNVKLLTKGNLLTHLNSQESNDFYSSIEDLSLKLHEISDLIQKVGQIHLINIDTEFLCQQDQYNVYNWWNLKMMIDHHYIDKNLFQVQHEPRQDSPTLFVAGCSITYGIGVENKDRYQTLLEKKLDMPSILLAAPASSIAWQADRILQSDIRKDDIVVWGLTNLSRVTISDKDYRDWTGFPIMKYDDAPPEIKYFSINYFDSWTLSLSGIKQILQVENFCRKIGAKLFLANLLESTVVPSIFGNQNNYINCVPEWDHGGRLKWLDLGSDNDHPGPLQHQLYAQLIYDKISQVKDCASA